MINLVCGIVPEMASSPEPSEFPNHDGDETDQKDKKYENVKNGKDPGFAHFGAPLEVNREQFHTVPVFPNSEHKEDDKS